jgi:adenylosuccinate synthase
MDLVALQYACMINGVTSIVLTKADVLDAFENLSVCTSYKIDGKLTKQIPFQLSRGILEPYYERFNGWKKDSSGFKQAGDLPEEMKNYIEFISNHLNTPVSFVSNGPGRDQIIKIRS